MANTRESTEKKEGAAPTHLDAEKKEPLNLSSSSPEEAVREVIKGKSGKISSEDEEKLVELGSKMIKENLTPKQAMGISNEMMEAIYSFGYRLYNNGKYQQAAPVFRLLVMLEPGQGKYLMGLAACFHMSKEYQNAATTYSLCGLIDLNDPLPYYHASDCYFQLGQKELAVKSLAISIQKMKDRPEYEALMNRAQINLELLDGGENILGTSQDKDQKKTDGEAVKKVA